MSVAAELEIVTATRLDIAAFYEEAFLGRSLRRLKLGGRVRARIFPENSRGLPCLYNEAIDADGPDAVLFVHDDVWIDDLFLIERLAEGLARFDVIGIAGNGRRVPRQVRFYCTPDGDGSLDAAHTSGRLGTGRPGRRVIDLGPAPRACELLDGVFLATRRSTLRRAGVRFDPRFDFHFYDMDFSRAARAGGLTLGTWPVVITHRSWGDYGERWSASRDVYLAKWPD